MGEALVQRVAGARPGVNGRNRGGTSRTFLRTTQTICLCLIGVGPRRPSRVRTSRTERTGNEGRGFLFEGRTSGASAPGLVCRTGPSTNTDKVLIAVRKIHRRSLFELTIRYFRKRLGYRRPLLESFVYDPRHILGGVLQGSREFCPIRRRRVR